MADYNVAAEIEIKGTGKAQESVKSVRSELRQLQNDLASGRLTGKEFDEATRRAGELRDRMNDVRQRVNNLANDTPRLLVMTEAAQGIAGGFAAAQGAIGLFAGQSEELQKTLLKVQSSLAVLNGIQAVANILNKDSAVSTILLGNAKRVLAVATGQATGALKLFRLALISTGVGALVVGLGFLISAFAKSTKSSDEFSESLLKTGKSIEEVNKKVKESAKELNLWQKTASFAIRLFAGDVAAAVYEADKLAERTVESNKTITNNLISELERRKARLQAAGKDTTEIEKQIINEKLKIIAKGSNDEKDLRNELALIDLRNEKKRADARLAAEKKAIDDRQAALEKLAQYEEQLAEERQKTKLEKVKLNEQAIIDTNKSFQKLRVGSLMEQMQEELNIEEQRRQDIIGIATDTANTLLNIGILFTKSGETLEKIRKGQTLVQIAQDTASAISSLVRASEGNPLNLLTGGVAGIIQFTAGISRIIANVAKAKELLTNKSPNIGNIGQPTNAAAQITTPRLRPVQTVQTFFQPAQPQQMEPVKAYVVESELSATQNRLSRIQKRATL